MRNQVDRVTAGKPGLAPAVPVSLGGGKAARSLRRLGTSVALVLAASACFVFAAADSATAAARSAEVGSWYLGLQTGGVFPDRARGVEDAPFVGLRFGKVLRPSWNLEVSVLESQHRGSPGVPRLTLRQFSFDAMRVFNRTGEAAPFVKVGVGLLQDQPSGRASRGNLMGEVGGGVLLHVWTSNNDQYSFDLRPEVDVRWDGCQNCGQTMTDTLVGIGFDFAFGGQGSAPAAAPAAALAPAPRPPAAAEPAHAPAPVPAPPPPAMPPPPPPPPKPVVLTRVHFATNSAHLKTESFKFLDRVAAGLKANPDIRIVIEGYTDSRGSVAYNLELSQHRADAVRDYLIADGVSATQLSAKGLGRADRVATNRTAAGRQANRRTVMRVVSQRNNVPVEKVLCGKTC